jgi:hypothetical protein
MDVQAHMALRGPVGDTSCCARIEQLWNGLRIALVSHPFAHALLRNKSANADCLDSTDAGGLSSGIFCTQIKVSTLVNQQSPQEQAHLLGAK